jgi:hypothetical protein
MKKTMLLLLLTALIILLNGCLHTLHPIFTVKDIVYESKLLGTWKTKTNGKEAQQVEITNLGSETGVDLPGRISSIKQKGYLVSYKNSDGSVSARYIAFLARIGKHFYFDYYPAEKNTDLRPDEFYLQHCVKMHTSYHVDFIKDGFQLSQLNADFINKLLDEKKIRIHYDTDTDGNKIITASTEELQQYLIKYADEPKAYESDKTIFSK